MIIVEQTRNDFENDIGPLLRSFYPGVHVCMKENPPKEPVEYRLRAEVGEHFLRLLFFDAEDRLIFDVSTAAELSDKKEYRNIIKRLLYRALSSYTKKTLPWGAQTGVRPAKIALDRLQEGWTEDDVRDFMKAHYLCSDQKTELALAIAKKEYSLLSGFEENGYSIYIGIAFCPSKCLYCSFPSYSVEKFGGMMDDYLLALFQEIDYAKDCMGTKQLQTVYVGGGTPTALDEARLERLMEKIRTALDFTFVREFTVEAGRPDSITREKLAILKRYGVTRISVNPQTMNQRTLDIIGRRHTVEDVKRAFFLAREEGHDNINMDLIMGLPGEDLPEVRHTLEEIRMLSPDSLTVHTLAMKRAADLNIYRERYQAIVPLNTAEMLALAETFTAENGYFPYYLYRQKNMTGNLENVGYAKEGKEGIYNILIMEEQQTILALGAGATTKRVFPGRQRIERCGNAKDLVSYIGRIDEMVERKRRLFQEE